MPAWACLGLLSPVRSTMHKGTFAQHGRKVSIGARSCAEQGPSMVRQSCSGTAVKHNPEGPSCYQKRALVTALHVAEKVCCLVPHRQVVLAIPKRLADTCFDRSLLGKLSVAA
jgi:hypothetical protein